MTARHRWIRAAVLCVAMGVGGAVPVTAQRMPGGRAQDREQLERRVRARFAETIQRRLGLTDEQGAALAAVMNGLQEDRRALVRDEQVLRRRMEAITVDDQAKDEEAREVLERMADLRLREARLFQLEQEKLLDILSPIQVVRFHAIREELMARIQQLRGGPPGPGRRPGGGGDGPFPLVPSHH